MKLQPGLKVKDAVRNLENFLKKYGQRALDAEANLGIDWKAVSHATRAVMQVLQILCQRDITFPLDCRKALLEIKRGEVDYAESVAPNLEFLMEIADKLAEQPGRIKDKPDEEKWNLFLHKIAAQTIIIDPTRVDPTRRK